MGESDSKKESQTMYPIAHRRENNETNKICIFSPKASEICGRLKVYVFLVK